MANLGVKAEPGKQEVIMTRVFNAPRERVFKAFTDPKAIAKWWGGSLYETTIDKMEAKTGGRWRFVQKGKADGNTHGFHGVYHDVTFPERIIQTFEYEGCQNRGTSCSRP